MVMAMERGQDSPAGKDVPRAELPRAIAAVLPVGDLCPVILRQLTTIQPEEVVASAMTHLQECAGCARRLPGRQNCN